MAKILSTAGITYEIENLMKASRGDKLILVTPYLKIANQFRNYIEDLDKFNTPIQIVVREGENHNTSDISFLQGLGNVSLFTVPNLHAKCYKNNDTAIQSSMNLYEYSQLNNVEIGIKIEKESDGELFTEIDNAVQEIIRSSSPFEYEIKKVSNPKESPNNSIKIKYNPKSNNTNIPKDGFCIRCGKSMSFDQKHPLCDQCYPIWAKYKDENFTEKFCHACGEDVPKHKSSYSKPLCYTCYKKIHP